jgi:hypothetical protein
MLSVGDYDVSSDLAPHKAYTFVPAVNDHVYMSWYSIFRFVEYFELGLQECDSV